MEVLPNHQAVEQHIHLQQQSSPACLQALVHQPPQRALVVVQALERQRLKLPQDLGANQRR